MKPPRQCVCGLGAYGVDERMRCMQSCWDVERRTTKDLDKLSGLSDPEKLFDLYQGSW
jgi:hypothetical protein